VLLPAAQSFFGVAVIANLRFSLLEASVVALLFGSQLFFPSPTVRYVYSIGYIVLTVLLLVLNRENRRGFFDLRRLRPGGEAARASNASSGNGVEDGARMATADPVKRETPRSAR